MKIYNNISGVKSGRKIKPYNKRIDFTDEYIIVVDQSLQSFDKTAIAIIKHTRSKKQVLETKIIEPREDIEEYVLKNASDWIKENNNKIITCVDLYDEFIKIK